MNAFVAKGVGDGVMREIVVLPIASAPDRSRLMVVPSTVIAGPPAEIMLSAMENAEGFGVKVWPATVKIFLEDRLVRETVLPIAKIPD